MNSDLISEELRKLRLIIESYMRVKDPKVYEEYIDILEG